LTIVASDRKSGIVKIKLKPILTAGCKILVNYFVDFLILCHASNSCTAACFEAVRNSESDRKGMKLEGEDCRGPLSRINERRGRFALFVHFYVVKSSFCSIMIAIIVALYFFLHILQSGDLWISIQYAIILNYL